MMGINRVMNIQSRIWWVSNSPKIYPIYQPHKFIQIPNIVQINDEFRPHVTVWVFKYISFKIIQIYPTCPPWSDNSSARTETTTKNRWFHIPSVSRNRSWYVSCFPPAEHAQHRPSRDQDQGTSSLKESAVTSGTFSMSSQGSWPPHFCGTGRHLCRVSTFLDRPTPLTSSVNPSRYGRPILNIGCLNTHEKEVPMCKFIMKKYTMVSRVCLISTGDGAI